MRLSNNTFSINYKLIAFVLAIIVAIATAFSLGFYADKDREWRVRIDKIFSNLEFNVTRLNPFKPRVQVIKLDIKHEDFQKIAYKREVALYKKFNISDNSDYVSAKLSTSENGKDKTVKAKVRLKGIFSDHWSNGDKWSLKVKTKGAVMGMKRFSLMVPKSRNYIYEWLFLKALKLEGLIARRLEYINLHINGKDYGLYTLEEDISTELIENNQLREGPILGFNKDQLVLDWARKGAAGSNFLTESSSFSSREIDVNKADEIQAGSPAYESYQKAISLLEAFRLKKLKASEVFDLNKMAKYLALRALFGSSEFDPNDIKFYYNPVTAKLEPIGSEIHHLNYIGSWWLNQTTGWTKEFNNLFFSDNKFFEAYIKELLRMSQKSYLDQFYVDIKPELKRVKKILEANIPFYKFHGRSLYKIQSLINRTLDPNKALLASLDHTGRGSIILQIANTEVVPIEVLSLSYKPETGKGFDTQKHTIIPAKKKNEAVNYQAVSFNLPANTATKNLISENLSLNYKVLGTEKIKSVPVSKWLAIKDSFVSQDLLKQASINKLYNFYFLDTSNTYIDKTIRIKPGIWTLRENLVIPQGFKLVAQAGTQIELQNKANIISFSPIEFIGTEAQPIIISATGTGQGLLVIKPDSVEEFKTSTVKYTVFNNLSNPNHQGWSIPGAVSFYEAPALISYTKFLNNRSEDSLNIMRSEFKLDHSLFDKAQSDAFDGDFVTGSITNSKFYNSGNDAIDFSGSVVDLNTITIDTAEDKGLSAGESSSFTAKKLDIKNTAIAVVSKDKSTINLQNSSISDSDVGFAVFQKKPEFGAAKIIASNLKTQALTNPYLVEKNSSLKIDDKSIKSNQAKVKELLYGAVYGKKTVK